MPDQEQLRPLAFPLQGIDVSTEFELQPAQTTPVGLNVRGYEPGTMRARGGSRPGLSKYVPATVNGAHLIQHLNYIVDPQDPALTTSSDDFGGGASEPDPSTNNGGNLRNPGRAVRVGGSGVQPNRNVFTKGAPVLTIRANNIHKTQGTTYTFSGTEFTETGLLPGDTLTSALLASAGAALSAPNGSYPVTIGSAFGVGLGRYSIQYVNGVMSVGTTQWEFTLDGAGSGFPEISSGPISLSPGFNFTTQLTSVHKNWWNGADPPKDFTFTYTATYNVTDNGDGTVTCSISVAGNGFFTGVPYKLTIPGSPSFGFSLGTAARMSANGAEGSLRAGAGTL